MKFSEFLKRFRTQPLIDSPMLSPLRQGPYGAVQLSRWVREGKLIQLRRGYYLFATEYRREEPSLFYLANMIHRPSYISLESALAEHGLIPESVPMVTSITTRRPAKFSTPLGQFRYQHMKPNLFFGYHQEPGNSPPILLASPEKALLDLIYFRSGPLFREWLEEMRLQNLERINEQPLRNFAERFGSKKIRDGALLFLEFRREWLKEFRILKKTKT